MKNIPIIFLIITQLILGGLFTYFFIPYRVVKTTDISTYPLHPISKLFTIIAVQQPFKIVSNETEEELPIIYHNSPIKFEMEYVKYIDLETNYSRFIICKDGGFIDLTRFMNVYQPVGDYRGENKIIPTSNILPSTANGVCKLVFPTTYHINDLKEVVTTVETELFYAKEATRATQKAQ